MTDIAPGVITISDLFREIVGMRADMNAAATKTALLEAHRAEAVGSLADHEGRIRVLETFRWKLMGMATVVGVLSGAFSGIVGFLIGH